MTTATVESDQQILRTAGRAWFRAGVRRGDRRRLTADLADELEGARAAGVTGFVLGRDPASAAREWAEAQGLTDRRTRVALLAPPMVVAGVLASGCVLAPVMQAFGNGGHWFLDRAGAAGTLAVYSGAAALAYLAMVAVAMAMLSMVDDASRWRSVRALLVALPLGGLLACAGAVAAAATLHFAVRPRTFTVVSLVVAVVLTVTIWGARALTTRGPVSVLAEAEGDPSA